MRRAHFVGKDLELAGDRGTVTLVAIAAVLVAGIRLRFLSLPFDRASPVPTEIGCEASFAKGDELGWFEHGSTILVLAPARFGLAAEVREGKLMRMGQPLLLAPG